MRTADVPTPTLTTVSAPVGFDTELAVLCKALGHPARVQILRRLLRSPCICGEIVQVVGLAQSTVSAHLRVLKEAGLVKGEVDGPRMCYCVNPDAVRRLQHLTGSLIDELEPRDRSDCC